MSIDRGMDKEDVVHIYNEILLSHKKEWNKPFAATWMELKMIILSKTDRQRQISQGITHMWNLTKKNDTWTYLQNRKWLTNIENKLMVTKGEGERGIN